MIFAVTCHCGRSIGDLYPVYTALRQEVIDKELQSLGRDIAPDLTYLATDFQPELGEILDKLQIDLECCRTRFLTAVEFDDLYG